MHTGAIYFQSGTKYLFQWCGSEAYLPDHYQIDVYDNDGLAASSTTTSENIWLNLQGGKSYTYTVAALSASGEVLDSESREVFIPVKNTGSYELLYAASNTLTMDSYNSFISDGVEEFYLSYGYVAFAADPKKAIHGEYFGLCDSFSNGKLLLVNSHISGTSEVYVNTGTQWDLVMSTESFINRNLASDSDVFAAGSTVYRWNGSQIEQLGVYDGGGILYVNGNFLYGSDGLYRLNDAGDYIRQYEWDIPDSYYYNSCDATDDFLVYNSDSSWDYQDKTYLQLNSFKIGSSVQEIQPVTVSNVEPFLKNGEWEMSLDKILIQADYMAVQIAGAKESFDGGKYTWQKKNFVSVFQYQESSNQWVDVWHNNGDNIKKGSRYDIYWNGNTLMKLVEGKTVSSQVLYKASSSSVVQKVSLSSVKTSVELDNVTLTINAKNAVEYRIEYDGKSFITTDDVYVIEGVGGGKKTFTVYAVGGDGKEVKKNVSVNITDFTAPNPVTVFADAVVDHKNYKATLNWEKPWDDVGVAKYAVRLFKDGELILEKTSSKNAFVTGKLICGDYSWQVRALDKAGNQSEWSLEQSFAVEDYTPPTLKSVKATVTGNLLTLDIFAEDKESSVAGYYVGGKFYENFHVSLEVEEGKNQTIKVYAVDEFGNESRSRDVKFSVKDYTPPEMIDSFRAVEINEKKYAAVIAWEAPYDAGGVKKYEIIIDGNEKGIKSSSKTVFTTGKLAAGQEHSYRVRAVDTAGNKGEWSSEQYFEMGDYTAPGKVSAKVAVTAENQLSFSWKPVKDNVGVVGYNIYFGTDKNRLDEVASLGNDAERFLYEERLDKGSYFYAVTAYDAAGNESDLKAGSVKVKTELAAVDAFSFGMSPCDFGRSGEPLELRNAFIA